MCGQADWVRKSDYRAEQGNWQAGQQIERRARQRNGQQIERQKDWQTRQQARQRPERERNDWQPEQSNWQTGQQAGQQIKRSAKQRNGRSSEYTFEQWPKQPQTQEPRMRANTRTRKNARRKMKQRSNKTLIRTILILILMIGAIKSCGTGIFDSPNAQEYGEPIDISSEVKKGEIPAFLQNDPRWGDKPYGNNTMAENGCGPTCLSMVYCFLTGDDAWNPYNLACKADEEGYYVNGSGTSWLAMTELASEIGLKSHEICFEESVITSELDKGTPIICSMKPGDFTTSGHFIVLTGIDKHGNVTVQDPNSKSNSKKTWPLKDLMPQISNLWGFETVSVFFF